jgi:negative regulator of flagellin synthesis FlgM
MTNISNITGKYEYEQAMLNEAAEKQRVETPAQPPIEETKVERVQDDKVSLSNESRDMQIAKDAVASNSDIRAEKVEELKQAVATGRYKVDPGAVAEKMISSNFSEVV